MREEEGGENKIGGNKGVYCSSGMMDKGGESRGTLFLYSQCIGNRKVEWVKRKQGRVILE